MIDIHTKNGYLELIPPALVNSESLQGSEHTKFSNESLNVLAAFYGFLLQLKFHLLLFTEMNY